MHTFLFIDYHLSSMVTNEPALIVETVALVERERVFKRIVYLN